MTSSSLVPPGSASASTWKSSLQNPSKTLPRSTAIFLCKVSLTRQYPPVTFSNMAIFPCKLSSISKKYLHQIQKKSSPPKPAPTLPRSTSISPCKLEIFITTNKQYNANLEQAFRQSFLGNFFFF